MVIQFYELEFVNSFGYFVVLTETVILLRLMKSCTFSYCHTFQEYLMVSNFFSAL